MTSYWIEHKVYCGDRNIQFVILFAIHFSFVEPFHLSRKDRFETIELMKKGAPEKYTLDSTDYAKVYDLYMAWVRESKKVRKSSEQIRLRIQSMHGKLRPAQD